MLVLRTKSQYLYIHKITHVFSNIHKNKHFHVSNTHINKKQYVHQNENWISSKPRTSPNFSLTITIKTKHKNKHYWKTNLSWPRARMRVRDDSESKSENGVVVPPQRLRESESENESARDKWEQEWEHKRWVTVRARVRDVISWLSWAWYHHRQHRVFSLHAQPRRQVVNY